jgi:hypothetical protein
VRTERERVLDIATPELELLWFSKSMKPEMRATAKAMIMTLSIVGEISWPVMPALSEMVKVTEVVMIATIATTASTTVRILFRISSPLPYVYDPPLGVNPT